MTTLADLTPDPRNARRHTPRNVSMIEQALGEVGAARSIVVDENNVVLAGNATIEAAAAAGIDRVQVVDADGQTIIAVRRSGLTPEQKQHLALYDNRTAELAEWDADVLAALGAEIDLSPFWSRDELASLIKRDVGNGGDEFDTTPLDGPTRVQPGELWQLGEHRVLCGDSTKRDDVARVMGGERAVLMATDPPYLVDYVGGAHPSSKANKGAANKDKDWSDTYREVDISEAMPFFTGFLNAAMCEALVSNAAMYVWHASARQPALEQAMRVCGILVHQQIIWVKSRAVLTYSHFMWKHEPCLYGWKEGHQPQHRPPANTPSVWEVSSRVEDGAKDVHPTMKPLELFTRPIEYHTVARDVVYEPFAGSGTTLIACERLQRRCRALELCPPFADVILRRWEAETGLTATRVEG